MNTSKAGLRRLSRKVADAAENGSRALDDDDEDYVREALEEALAALDDVELMLADLMAEKSR